MFTSKGNHRISAQLAGPAAGDKRSRGANKRKLFLSIATVAAAGFSGAVVAAPAHASTTTADVGTDLLAGSIAAPYSAEEIRSLQQLDDLLGANSRITANQYALGNMYRSN
ncbi:hypothetical protein FHJ30_09700 [Arthrobacter sp. BB-1]|uniref:hypothetical protein n=1 Tax=unclassified Arthrobacter TaxID=235627 RepID=UPI001112C463|nr:MULTISPECIES: hypothetical protein [unclassified Arthrobacter]TNB72568.1 hypothetical protein FHJ30_09700 [Arthrobacter sp. BB-1]